MKGSGVLVGNFELNLLGRLTWAWAILLLIPERDKEPLTNRETVTEDVLLKVFTAVYWIVKKSYLTTRSSYM